MLVLSFICNVVVAFGLVVLFGKMDMIFILLRLTMHLRSSMLLDVNNMWSALDRC